MTQHFIQHREEAVRLRLVTTIKMQIARDFLRENACAMPTMLAEVLKRPNIPSNI